MFRGLRWQLIALTIAIAVFLAALFFRINRQTSGLPAASPSPPAVNTSVAMPTAGVQPSPTAGEIEAPADPAGLSGDSAPAYREGLIGEARRLNPLFAHLNPVDRDISSLIFEGLFATNDYGEILPRLAEQLVISADGIEYVVSLRQDARWQDGAPFSAADVAYTMSLLSDPDYAAISPLGQFWSTVETQPLNDHLLRFRLAQPLSGFPHLLTIGILPEHALRGTRISQLAQHPFNLSPIGTGPYQLAHLQLGPGNSISAVELARAPLFHERAEAQGSYSLTPLRFQLYPNAAAAQEAYHAGAINVLANVRPSDHSLSLPNSRLYTQVAPSVVMLIFNWKEALLAERRVRHALALSLDLPYLARKNFGADVTYADSPYTPGSSVYMPQEFWQTFDIAQARALLDAAGLLAAEADAADAGAAEAGYRLLIEDSPPLRNLAEDIANQWRQLGLEAQVDAVGAADFANRLASGRFEMAIVELPVGADFDLYRYWHPAQFGAGQNYGAAADHEVAELIEQARREIYTNRRAMLYQQLQAAFAEQVIAIPLYYPLYTVVASRQLENLQLGYLAAPADRFRGIGGWRLATVTS